MSTGSRYCGTATSARRVRQVLTIAAATSTGSTVGNPRPRVSPEDRRVRTAEGSTQLTLTPDSANSSRVAAESPTAANLLALYTASPGSGIFPASEATLTI